MADNAQVDAIVVGSGITGGWAAKQLTEAGLKVLMIERGRKIEHQVGYETETKAPWEMPFRGVGDEKRYRREFPVQMLNRHFTEFTEGISSTTRKTPIPRPRGPTSLGSAAIISGGGH